MWPTDIESDQLVHAVLKLSSSTALQSRPGYEDALSFVMGQRRILSLRSASLLAGWCVDMKGSQGEKVVLVLLGLGSNKLELLPSEKVQVTTDEYSLNCYICALSKPIYLRSHYILWKSCSLVDRALIDGLYSCHLRLLALVVLSRG